MDPCAYSGICKATADELRAENARLREALGWKTIDRKDLPKNHEKMSYSRDYMLELCEMQRAENARLREALEEIAADISSETITLIYNWGAPLRKIQEKVTTILKK